jgi:hypothetical protein
MITTTYDESSLPWSYSTFARRAITENSSSIPAHGEVYLIKPYVIKLATDLRQCL